VSAVLLSPLASFLLFSLDFVALTCLYLYNLSIDRYKIESRRLSGNSGRLTSCIAFSFHTKTNTVMAEFLKLFWHMLLLFYLSGVLWPAFK